MSIRTIGALPSEPSGLSDERTVDLQRVDGKVAHVPQRRVAGAEIVDAQRNPAPAQFRQPPERERVAAHDRALGHLDRDRVRRELVPP